MFNFFFIFRLRFGWSKVILTLVWGSSLWDTFSLFTKINHVTKCFNLRHLWFNMLWQGEQDEGREGTVQARWPVLSPSLLSLLLLCFRSASMRDARPVQCAEAHYHSRQWPRAVPSRPSSRTPCHSMFFTHIIDLEKHFFHKHKLSQRQNSLIQAYTVCCLW